MSTISVEAGRFDQYALDLNEDLESSKVPSHPFL